MCILLRASLGVIQVIDCPSAWLLVVSSKGASPYKGRLGLYCGLLGRWCTSAQAIYLAVDCGTSDELFRSVPL